MEGPPRAILKESAIENAMIKAAEVNGQALVQELRKRTGEKLAVEIKVLKGYPVHDVVEECARQAGAGLVVIGTRGASGIKIVLLGSTATSVIDHSSIPVIAVPELAQYKGIKKVLYATDLIHLEEEIEALAFFTAIFKARMDAVHVSIPDEELTTEEQQVLERLSSGNLHPEIYFHALRGESVVEAINKFATVNQANLIALFTHHLGFFKRLFNKSVAREMAFHTQIPLFTFRKN